MQHEQFIERLWGKDPTVWTAHAQAHAAILERLGWLTVPPKMVPHITRIQQLLQALQRDGITHGVLLGMGGSSLFAEVCRQIFGVQGGLDMAILDSTDPTAIRAVLKRSPTKNLLAVVASKSGTTAEVSALMKYFDALLVRELAHAAGQHAIAITDKDTVLEAHAKQAGYRQLFILDRDYGSDVGGRFSALTYFGLVPAVLMGVDGLRLLRAGLAMLEACGPQAGAEENPALALAAAVGGLGLEGKNKLTFLTGQAIQSFGLWAEQLVAESTGKNGKGILPVVAEPWRAPIDYAADRVFIEMQLAAQPDRVLRSHTDALIAAGHPVVRIEWQDAYDLGGEVVKWSVATALIGALQGENPFDEPNVKEAKACTHEFLRNYTQQGRLPEPVVLVEDAAAALAGSRAVVGDKAPHGVAEALSGFFGTLQPYDYVAVLNFLPRIAELDRFVAELSAALVEHLPHAVSLQFGPRYLHSTGQLHKGGHNTGVFLELTAQSPEDLDIPHEAFSFGVLKQAQALGDWQALCDGGRRVLRVHLKAPLAASAQQVLNAVRRVLQQCSTMK
jgi:glucose-6-phosphate isomerase/transaldolase/glucose-6-phosphate isomerase